MACSVDHSKLSGLKFCTECGAALEPVKRICTEGHELVRKNKFCETCGSPEASGLITPTPATPSLMTPRVVQPPTPSYTPQKTNSDPLLPPPSVPYSAPKNKNLVAIIASASAALLVIVAVLVNVNKVTYTNVEVSMSIYDENCWNLGWGYFDIPGGEVVLSMDGVDVAWAEYPNVGTDVYLACKFTTTFYDVPMNGDVYEFSMSSGRRGTITKTQSELVANGWTLDLSLGL